MHRHGEAHDVFYCERGAIQVWFDGESRILHPGDAASVPPGTLHAYALVRPHSRSVGPITPGGWERFFAFVGTPYDGPAFPPEDHSPPPFAKHDGHSVLYVLDGHVRVGGVGAGPGDCVSLPAGDWQVEVVGAQARWLATYAPAGPEGRGEPWAFEVFPAPGG